MVPYSARLAWSSATGAKRTSAPNDDRFAADGRTFAVADGMGSRPGGDVAAEEAIAAVVGALEVEAPSATVLCTAIERAQRAVAAAGARLALPAMATTLAVVAIAGPRVHVAHVGDTRVYRRSSGRLELVTSDHTAAAEAGLADASPLAGALTRYLGTEADAAVPDVRSIAVRPGDRYVLCSDGVHRAVDAVELARCADEPIFSAASALVDAARRNATRDDATAVVIELL